ncbi:MAG TPA: UDP-N-acetylmuramoyl-L-alanyl-D-glutamate--2,6-diaminopimelate ligase [Candidatus Woesebacteria bacterium]|nr:UDP-N-acetylmuramoyl-L-alanyl-D-glutamate--2,6-diaminopimelate ligase [Candidatus Woesebacteria bacterium]
MIQKLKNIFIHLPKSIFYNFYYGFPSKKLTLIGVTGTDGKTTTCTLIHEILKQSGLKTGLITTIGAKVEDREIDTGFHTTTPDPSLLQKILAEMVKAGMTHVVCEVTSHALDQYRFLGCQFEISGITNTSHEHLDYHKNLTNYINTKAKLFSISKSAVLNKDDQSFEIIKKQIKTPFKTFSIKENSDYQAKKIKLDQNLLNFEVNDQKFTTDSNYEYQIYNILLALAICQKLKIDLSLVQKTIEHFPETKGRREEIPNDFKFKTIIDFAHTPFALEASLSSLRKIDKGNLIVIFGATGGRDQSKRPEMGKVVSKQANIAFITADDTRNEKIEDINKQIISGIDPKKSELIDYQEIKNKKQIQNIIELSKQKFIYFNIPNRQDAFNLAIKFAQPQDIVIACGKGHETTILHGRTEYPWSEAEAFRTAFRLKKLNKNGSI